MKKQYENPMIEIQVVDDIDILTASTNLAEYDGDATGDDIFD